MVGSLNGFRDCLKNFPDDLTTWYGVSASPSTHCGNNFTGFGDRGCNDSRTFDSHATRPDRSGGVLRRLYCRRSCGLKLLPRHSLLRWRQTSAFNQINKDLGVSASGGDSNTVRNRIRKPKSIRTKKRIGSDVAVGINAPAHPDRIALHVTPNGRVVIPMPVVEHPLRRTSVVPEGVFPSAIKDLRVDEEDVLRAVGANFA